MRDVLDRDRNHIPFPSSGCFKHLGMDGIKLKGSSRTDLDKEPDFYLNRFSDQEQLEDFVTTIVHESVPNLIGAVLDGSDEIKDALFSSQDAFVGWSRTSSQNRRSPSQSRLGRSLWLSRRTSSSATRMGSGKPLRQQAAQRRRFAKTENEQVPTVYKQVEAAPACRLGRYFASTFRGFGRARGTARTPTMGLRARLWCLTLAAGGSTRARPTWSRF
jgi:hypothetical protein